tara:strand:+ start:348 stop:1919 length:1572 start_codon:yes stop_codon:yes gene_type:complete
MNKHEKNERFADLRHDVSASIVVFFVAFPLCLGIALASGAPLFSGIIAGIVGGIVVGAASQSALGVSGPAAGLAVIVFNSIGTLGSWPTFLLAVVLAGIFQLIMGFMRVGFIAFFFPSSVIKGMLSGIGLLIILKQIPHALGYDKDALGDLAFMQTNGETTLSSITHIISAIHLGAALISCLSVLIMIIWDGNLSKRSRFFRVIQGPIIVVLAGIIINMIFQSNQSVLSLGATHLVNLPVADTLTDFMNQFTLPNFYAISNVYVWKSAIVIAIVASLETLLCVEATDKLDPYKRITPPNRELKAQGLGNIISGLCGGLPITQVIIRSSANISFGARSKLSAILHGVFILISAYTIANFLNMIPLASLASILIVIGYKLINPTIIQRTFKLGAEQFVPFFATIVGILMTDLLQGIAIGLVFGLFYTLRHSYRNAYYMTDITENENGHTVHRFMLAEEVSFFNKGSIIKALTSVPENSKIIIDCTNSKAIAYDVVEFIQDYKKNAHLKNISVETVKFLEPNLPTI